MLTVKIETGYGVEIRKFKSEKMDLIVNKLKSANYMFSIYDENNVVVYKAQGVRKMANNTLENIEVYVKKMEELKKLGEYIMSIASEDDFDEYDDILNEIDNMDMHFDCSLNILNGQYKV